MNLLTRIRTFLHHERIVLQKAYYRHTDREKLLATRYEERFGEKPDLQNPKNFNEKILWLMLHADDRRWTQLADKYRVREYLEQCGLKHLLNDLYAVWEQEHEINLDDPRLPDSFVLKSNNGYGDVILVRDRQSVDLQAIRLKMHSALTRRFGRKTGEWHYLAIKPCIIAERLLPADPAFGSTLVDFKFYCFDGEPRYCLVCRDRTSPSHATKELYEARTWKSLEGYLRPGPTRTPRHNFPRPRSLDEMLDAAERLAKGFSTVRVDFYEVAGRPVFGEMTFTPAAGGTLNFSDEFLRIMGDQIHLPAPARP